MTNNHSLNEIEVFELTHAVAVDNALNALAAALFKSHMIDRSTVALIGAAYRKPLEKQRANPLLVSVLNMHDRAFGQLLAHSDAGARDSGQ